MHVNALPRPLGRIVEMNTCVSRIRCQPCGMLFPVIGAREGVVVRCPVCYRMLTIRLVSLPTRKQALRTSAEPELGEVLLKVLGYASVVSQ
jgi:hypothetical protein